MCWKNPQYLAGVSQHEDNLAERLGRKNDSKVA